jgi:hypothetical protein
MKIKEKQRKTKKTFYRIKKSKKGVDKRLSLW